MFVEVTSRAAEDTGFVVPIPTCAFAGKAERSRKPYKRKFLVFISKILVREGTKKRLRLRRRGTAEGI